MNKFSAPVVILYVLFVLETIFYTIGKKWVGELINPMLLTAITAGILIYAWKAGEGRDKLTDKGKEWPATRIKWICVGIAAAVFIEFSFFFASEPIDINKSDIIPIIQQYYVDRFLSGEFVYAPVDRGDYIWYPNYFPMHWLPFCVSQLLHMDHRTLAILVLLIVILYYQFRVIDLEGSRVARVVELVLPFLPLLLMRMDARILLGHTVETMICAYYFLFGITIGGRKILLRSAGLSAILLSRFSIVLWMPFYLVSSLMHNRKSTIRLCIYAALFAMALFIVPFVIRDPSLLVNGFSAFKKVYLDEWDGQAWQQPGDKPYQLFQGLGYACYFYNWWPGELVSRLDAVVWAQIAGTLSITVLSLILLRQANRIGIGLYQLLSVKAFLFVFYSLIVVPYQYLFLVPLYITIAIIHQLSVPNRSEI